MAARSGAHAGSARSWGSPSTAPSYCSSAVARCAAPVESKLVRNARNLTVAGIGAAALQLADAPSYRSLAGRSSAGAGGSSPASACRARSDGARARPPRLHALPLARLVHQVPALWRFHRVHHGDLDLDASTALRFHFGELVPSFGWNAPEVAAHRRPARTFRLRQRLLLVSILFHHSDLRCRSRSSAACAARGDAAHARRSTTRSCERRRAPTGPAASRSGTGCTARCG